MLSVLCVVFMAISSGAHAQISSEHLSIENLITEDLIYLKGPFHQPINNRIENRSIFEIEIPKNTLYLVYGYTTASGKTIPEPLNLKSQILSKIKPNTILDLDVIRSVSVPDGKVNINLYLMDNINRDKYLKFSSNMNGDYRYFTEGTRLAQNNGLIVLSELPENPLYIIYELKSNTKSLTGNLEVFAIIDSNIETIEIRQRRALEFAEKAETYISNQEYLKAYDYCKRSFKLYELGWVQANIGLTELALKKPDKALETYKAALELIIRQPNEDFILKKVDKDLQQLKSTLNTVKGIEPVENLIALFRE